MGNINQGSLDQSMQLLKVDRLLTPTVELKNAGAGSNPKITSNSAANLINFDGSILTTGSLYSNAIKERTVGGGVDIDGLIVKDEGINFPTPDVRIMPDIANVIKVRNIVDDAWKAMKFGYGYFYSPIQVSIIEELSLNTGVTIDGNLIKDGNIAAALLLGSSNKAFIPVFPIAGQDPLDLEYYTYYNINVLRDANIWYDLPYPPIFGALKLYVKDVRLSIRTFGNSPSDNIDHVRVMAHTRLDGTVTTISESLVNITAEDITTISFGAVDVSAYADIFVELRAVFDNLIIIGSVELECYYA